MPPRTKKQRSALHASTNTTVAGNGTEQNQPPGARAQNTEQVFCATTAVHEVFRHQCRNKLMVAACTELHILAL